HHPGDLFGRPHEAALVDPTNPYVLAPHLLCAAFEQPLPDQDMELFGGDTARALAEALEAEGALRRRRDRLHPGSGLSQADQVDIRNAGGSPVTIVAADSGQLIGTVDRARAPSTVHRGAVYLHQGEHFRVAELDLEEGVALVTEAKGDEYTQARSDINITVVEPTLQVELPRSTLWLGRVDVSEQVVGYERRRVGTRELLGDAERALCPAPPPGSAGSTSPSRWSATSGAGSGPASCSATRSSTCPRPTSRQSPTGTRSPPVCWTPPPSPPRTSPAPPTPPSMRRAGCCPCSPCATAGTSAGSPPPGTPTRARPRSSSTTAIPAAPASLNRATAAPLSTCGRPATRSHPASVTPAVPPASSPPSAATATTPSTRLGPAACAT